MTHKNSPAKIILAVFAHPDDETFMAGGFLRAMTDANHEVFLFTVTEGERGGDPAVRVKELRKAARLLGVKKVYQDTFLDGRLRDLKGLLEGEVKRLILRLKPHIIVTFHSMGKDREGVNPHPDHKTVSLVVQKIFRCFKKGKERSDWRPEALYLALPVFPSCRVQKNAKNFNIRKYVPVKVEALQTYGSQGMGCWETLGTDWAKYVCPHESFVIL